MLIEFFFRLLGMVIFGLGGWLLSPLLGVSDQFWYLSLILGGMVVGFLVSPYLTTRPFRWARRKIEQIPTTAFLAALVGLVIGLVISAFLALPLSMLPGLFGKVLPLAFSLLLSYLGVSIMIVRQRDLVQLLSSLSGLGVEPRGGASSNSKVVLDTSVIIDGRIADIAQTGFIQGTLLIPRFVLDELRHIADSPDALRRNRGRRGLDILNKLQKESEVPIQISDVDFDDAPDVDSKLVKLAKVLRSPIITNDFNLNRVADLQGVRVLNVNELANAVKSVVLPGEEMSVRIIQEGKEAGQGVGFLDDGTMVVVEGGRRHINSQLDIIVTRVLQTAAGRMIFAHSKLG